jgi:hypothetical protein
VPEEDDEEPEYEDDDPEGPDEGHAVTAEGSTEDDVAADDHVSGDEVEEPPAAGQGPGRNRGRSRRGKRNDGDDQTDTDGPPII